MDLSMKRPYLVIISFKFSGKMMVDLVGLLAYLAICLGKQLLRFYLIVYLKCASG